MKYLMCDCCGFLAVIPDKDDEKDIDCPFCKKVNCDHGGFFVIVSREMFCKDADIPAPVPESTLADLKYFINKRLITLAVPSSYLLGI